MDHNEKLLIFVHIPKTAGITIRSHIKKHFTPKEILSIYGKGNTSDYISKLSPTHRKTIKTLMGHMSYGQHKYFSQKSTYITFMRHPAARIISYYYWLRSRRQNTFSLLSGNLNPRNKSYNSFKKQIDRASELSLIDYIKNTPGLHNRQIQHISGDTVGANIKQSRLKIAKERLESDFKFCGIVEELDDSLNILNKLMSWKQTPYKTKNITKGKPNASDIPNIVIDEIHEMLHEDILLYDHAKKIFHEKKKIYLSSTV